MVPRLRSLFDLLGTVEFQTGFLIGLAGLAVSLLFGRRRLDWALVWTLCVAGALIRTGAFAERRPVRSLDFQLWELMAVLVVCAVAAVGLARGKAHSHLATGFIVSLLGLWATVPDTEAPSVLLGVTAAMVWSWWPLRFASPRVLGSATAAAAVALSAIIGSGRRDVAVVGGLGIVAVLGSLGLPTRWLGKPSAPIDIGLQIALIGVWFIAARVWSGPVEVFASGAIASALVLAAGWLVARRTRPSANQVEDPGEDPIAPGLVE
jgi:hypothetical protein